MASISRSALVHYTAREMFDLVDDVDRYKEFLPWCSDSGTLWHEADERKAFITISKGGISKSFSTINRVQPGKMLEMRLVEGPFQRLDGYWRFQDLAEDASKVSLDLEFEFSSTLVRMAFGRMFDQLANRLVDAFVERASSVYGKRGG